MRRIVLATNNPGKVREFNAVLAGFDLEILPQSAFNVPEAEETGLTFVENALLKARNAALHSGLPALADDSGLVVDALGGAPGIHSARYAGPGADDRANIAKLLAELSRRTGGAAHGPVRLRVGPAAPSHRSNAADLSGKLGRRHSDRTARRERIWLRSGLLRARRAAHRRRTGAGG